MAHQQPPHSLTSTSADSIVSECNSGPADKELDSILFERDHTGSSEGAIQTNGTAYLYLEQFYKASGVNLEVEMNDRAGSIEIEMKIRASEALSDRRMSIQRGLDRLSLQKDLDRLSLQRDLNRLSLQLERNGDRYLTGYKLFLVFLGFLLSMFLIILDQCTVAIAQPKLVSAFDALDQIAWVSSAFFLTQAGFTLPVGQILNVVSTKMVYLASIALFELGSVICGAAPKIEVLILGRAVAGAGAAGIFTAVISIIAEVTKLEDRSLLLGTCGAVFAIAFTVGPLLGGAFTDHVSWRWCFYINLPFGGLAIIPALLYFDSKGVLRSEESNKMTLKQKFLSIDYIGTALTLGVVTSFILALQWGGNRKLWNDKDVIATLVVAGVLLVMFGAWEYHLGPKAMVPLNLLMRRTQTAAAAESFFLYFLSSVGTYYIPLWYQSKGASASHSGIAILPFMLSIIISASMSGAIIKKIHRYWWFLVLAPPIASIGAGLLFTITPRTSNSYVIGYQILLGVGTGGALQNIIVAIQTEYAKEEHLIPQGTALVNFLETLGAAMGITVGAAIFGNQLVTNIVKFAPELSPEQAMAIRSSVTAIFELPKELQTQAIKAYSSSLDKVFLVCVPAGALASIAGLFVKNYNVRERSPTGGLGGGGMA